MGWLRSGFDFGYWWRYLRFKKANPILTQGKHEALEMTGNDLEKKIVETSVLVCVTSAPKEKECYLTALRHYENELSTSHEFCNVNHWHLDNDAEFGA